MVLKYSFWVAHIENFSQSELCYKQKLNINSLSFYKPYHEHLIFS